MRVRFERLVARLCAARSISVSPSLRGAALYAGLFVVGFLLAYFRLPPSSSEHMWQEDGNVFLAQAMQHPFLVALFEPYAGYGHLVPRLVAALADLFPLVHAPRVIAVVMALFLAALAAGIFFLLAAHLRTITARILVWCLVVAAPVAGLEIALSAANAQWYLLFGAFIAVFARREGVVATAISAAILIAAVGSSPLALVVFVPLVLIRTLALRGRGDIVIAASAVLAGIFQLIVMLRGTRQLHALRSAWAIIKTYLVDVQDVGWFGPLWIHQAAFMMPALIALGVLLTLAAFWISWMLRRWSTLPLSALVVGAAYFLAIVVLSGYAYTDPDQMLFIGVGSRYFVFPIMATSLIIGTGVDRLIAIRTRRSIALAVVAILLTLSVIVVNYRAFDQRARFLSRWPVWSAAVEHARATCLDDPTKSVYVIGGPQFSPFDSFHIPCDVLEDHR
ncbi:hypothetical protein [Humibacter ginsenosidimutans]|uniref:Dolichyl-phosphate-mannose-protein mannosyltransferase n=1 Tax=Humibacter ginsenosidimutans TaxID=2599293 RepID=A0A5B8M9U9_9MICO|nr:hypothetical protein [Humibacter ginsenosidimutans]QDZ16415.1 hypothetical protein FPZ11_18160 [Humibacter ginsenosidimutans]